MSTRESFSQDIDWLTVLLYGVLVLAGWLNIFAAVYDVETHPNIFDFSINSGKQLVWIGTSFLFIIIPIMAIDFKFYSTFAYIIYGLMILLLVATIFIGSDIKGSHSWIKIGTFSIQPAEFAKFATALALANYLGRINVKFERIQTQMICAAIIGLPCVIILLQNETGTVLVFSAFILVLYREGLSPVILIIGVACVTVFILSLAMDQYTLLISIGVLTVVILSYLLYKMFNGIARKRIDKVRPQVNRMLIIAAGAIVICGVVLSVNYFVENVLQTHQQKRIKILFNPDADPLGAGYNVTQSKIAIGSGEFVGKGFLQGTQTKFDFVPEQSTDFIFCTIGEEHGWLGSSVVITLYVILLLRIVFLAERQKDKFARIYGYSVACIIFFHFTINIGMTIGLFPVIG
ncbi:MAG: rod shape-determining protein RodA, partial [Cytophagaceae bacterium]